MQQRLSIKDLEPNAYKGLLELEKYLAASALPLLTKELIKIRASQIKRLCLLYRIAYSRSTQSRRDRATHLCS